MGRAFSCLNYIDGQFLFSFNQNRRLSFKDRVVSSMQCQMNDESLNPICRWGSINKFPKYKTV